MCKRNGVPCTFVFYVYFYKKVKMKVQNVNDSPKNGLDQIMTHENECTFPSVLKNYNNKMNDKADGVFTTL